MARATMPARDVTPVLILALTIVGGCGGNEETTSESVVATGVSPSAAEGNAPADAGQEMLSESNPVPADVPPAGEPPSGEPQDAAADSSRANSDQELAALIENLWSQRQVPLNSIPALPLPDRKPFIRGSDGGITRVDLSYTPAVDHDLAQLAELSSLEELRLTGTKITDAGLAHLAGSGSLKMLTLFGTAVSDASLEHLKQMTQLEYLGINSTNVSEEGITELKSALPDCRVQ